jgi:hypothetical protein
MRNRFWFESALTLASGLFLALTLVWKDWIEAVLHVDPDRHNGSLEWIIAGTLCSLTLALGLLTRSEWRRRPSHL